MDFAEAQKLIAESTRIVGFTGAGISTESGIPDFRSPGGVWANNRTVDYDEFIRYRESRIEYWRQKVAMWPEMRDAEPNAGHLAFAELEQRGKLLALITQNIDRLHHKAGNQEVIELHGRATEVECLTCHQLLPMEAAVARITAGDPAPECDDCGGYLKPATISFGQSMPALALELAVNACLTCELLIVAGSALEVYPAASLPEVAKRSGAYLIIINRTPTSFDQLADLVIREPIGLSLPRLLDLN